MYSSKDGEQKQGIQVRQIQEINIPPNDIVKAIIQSDRYIDVVHQQQRTRTARIIHDRSSGMYYNLRTGEVRSYLVRSREERLISRWRAMRRSYTHLLQIIRHNFKEQSMKQAHVTLTYKSVSDLDCHYQHKWLYDDFKSFVERFRGAYGEVDYVVVPERHENMRWHMHVLLRSSHSLVISNAQVTKLWGLGRVDVRPMRASRISKYLIKSFNMIDEEKVTKNKSMQLDAVLLYPSRFRLYRHSKGIKSPKVDYVAMKEIDAIGLKLWGATYEVCDSGEVVNRITKRAYRVKRGFALGFSSRLPEGDSDLGAVGVIG